MLAASGHAAIMKRREHRSAGEQDCRAEKSVPLDLHDRQVRSVRRRRRRTARGEGTLNRPRARTARRL